MNTVSENRSNAQAFTKIRSVLLFGLRSYQPKLIRLVIVLGVPATAAMLGFLATKRDPLYALVVAVAPLSLLGLELVLKYRPLAPLLILFAAAFVPLSFSTGTESRIVLSLLLTMLFVVIWTVRMLMEKRLRLEPSAANRPLLGFIFVTLFSLAWSTIYRDPLVLTWRSFPIVQLASTIVMIMLPGALLLVANQVSEIRWLKVMVALMLVAGALGLIRQYGLTNLSVNTGGLFTMWVVTLSTGLAFFNHQITWKKRAVLLLLSSVWVIWGFVLHISWLAGWLPGFVAIAVLSFMRSRKLFWVLLALVLVFVWVRRDYYLADINAESKISGETRMAAWEMNWRVTSNHLIFGTGPAGYAAYYMYYFPTQAMATHNNYIDILAQTGIIGFGLCVWFFFALAWTGYKLCLRLRGRGDFLEGLANAALAGTVSCMVAMAFGDWIFPFAYTQTIAGFDYAVYNWLFMGTILVVDRLTAPKLGAIANA